MPRRDKRIVAVKGDSLDAKFKGKFVAVGRVQFDNGLSDLVSWQEARRIAAMTGFTFGEPEEMEELHAHLLEVEPEEEPDPAGEEAESEEAEPKPDEEEEAIAEVEAAAEEEEDAPAEEDTGDKEAVPESEEEAVEVDRVEEETLDLASEINAVAEEGVPAWFEEGAPGYHDLISHVQAGTLVSGGASESYPEGIKIYGVIGSPNKAQALAAYYLIAGRPEAPSA